MVIWLIGLSGAGKTTIGRALYARWKAEAPNTVFIDGDEVREIFRHDRGDDPYTVDGRRLNSDRIQALCAMLDRQDINVVCCILSLFEEARRRNRTLFGDYFEVYLDAPMAVLQDRDPKGLYAAAARGEQTNVVGMDIPFAPPEAPDMVVDTGPGARDPDAVAADILAAAGAGRRE